MKEIYEKILNDEEIINTYKKIHAYENIEKGWAYHDYNHVQNVSSLVEQIFRMLNLDEELMYSAKIAAILHDVGALQGKENHPLRSYEYVKKYFENNNIEFKYKEDVLEAIRIHSDGVDTQNIIALALILADKLDVKYTRITQEGQKVVGNRQYANVLDIDIKMLNNCMTVKFITNDKFDLKEFDDYYFTKKIYKAIESFANILKLNYTIIINDLALNK